MENYHETEILRLNKKIKDLLAGNERILTLNTQLEKLNKNYLDELNKTKSDCLYLTNVNNQLRLDLNKTNTERNNIYEAHQKQKVNLNELVDKCRELNDKVKMLQDALGVKGVVPYISEPRKTVQIIGSIAELNPEEKLNTKITILESKIDTLESELQKSYDIIDELEFELDSIDYLEIENDRLQNELKMLNEQLHKENNVEQENNNTNQILTNRSVEKQAKRIHLHKKIETLQLEKQCLSNVDVLTTTETATTTTTLI